MTREDVQRWLCEVIAAIQSDSGRETPPLSDHTVPLRDLAEFDSLACVDAEVRLSELMGVEIESIPFKVVEGGQRQTIGEIADYLVSRYGGRDKESEGDT